MIVLFTDFGSGPYVGQMKAVLWHTAPGTAVIDLFDDVPAHDPRSAGLSTLDSVTDHGDGTYTLRLRPGAGPGMDRLRFVVEDGVRPVTLWPPATLLHEPPEPEPLNEIGRAHV